MKARMDQFPAMNQNPVISVASDCTVLYSNEAGKPLLYEWGVRIGEKLPSSIVDLVQKVLYLNSPEKMEVKVGNRVYLIVFHPLPKEECVNISGFDISDQKEFEDKLKESEALEIANVELSEIVNIQAIHSLMDDLYKLVHIPIGINDLKGNVLACVGWQDICIKFHRVHHEAFKYCVESDTKLSSGVLLGEFKLYKCKNNMYDIVTPIMVGSHYVGYVFGGQFFFDDEPLDYELFRSQARKYGFNEEEYIAALKKVPRLSREAVKTGMSFFMTFANMLSQLSNSNIKLTHSLAKRDSLVDALREREKSERARLDELAVVLDAVPAAVWITHDPQAFHITGNSLSYEWLRMPEGSNVSKAAPKGEGHETYRLFKDGMETPLADMLMCMSASGKEVHDYEFDITYPDGTMRHLLGNSKPLHDEKGNPRGSVSAFIDITERKKAEEALRLSNIYNRSLIEASLDPLVTIGHDGKIMDVNYATEKVTGYSRNNLIRTDFSDYFSDPEKARKGYQQVFAQGEVRDYPLEIQHHDGHIIPVLYNASVYRNENGEVIGVFAVAHDITELKKAKEKIQTLANTVESSDDAIITESLDGVIASWNKGAEKVHGYSAEEILGKHISILEPDNLKGEMKRFSEKIKQGERIQHYETLRLKKDGTIINVSLTHSPVFDISGELMAISTIARDITDKKIAEKLLKENQVADVANHTKSEFLANMSHELRTPLNSIIGFSDILYEQMYGELNKKQLKYVGNISKSGKHLLKLINNILDISKIEAGKMELSYKNFELGSKLNMIRNILFPIADQKNIKIEIDINSKLGTICADEDKFVQIMYNLVDNAIKFSYENSLVKIGARKKGDLVEITVKDTGIGIKAENQNKLFKPFSQIDSFSSRKSQGTGLGLHLVKQIVHMHRGYVWFRSNSSNGSTFAFAIPISNNKGNS